MKTVMIWDTFGEDHLKFSVLDGDYRHLDQVYLGSAVTKGDPQNLAPKLEELTSLVYDDDWKEKIPLSQEFPVDAVKDGAFVIVCGFLP